MTLDYWEMDEDQDDDIYSIVGYFVIQFSGAEIALTALLSFVSGIDDMETFHILTKGMDSKAKVGKLKELTKPKSLIVKDGAFDRRLTHFYDKTVELRNKLAHGWLVQAKGLPQTLLIANFGKLPFKAFKMIRRHGDEPDRIAFDALIEHANWTVKFCEDLFSLVDLAKKGKVLELKSPRSLEPKELLKRLEKIERHASDHTRRQSPATK